MFGEGPPSLMNKYEKLYLNFVLTRNTSPSKIKSRKTDVGRRKDIIAEQQILCIAYMKSRRSSFK